ncbi:hypothetical protein RSOLAG22IIIB_07732 [Rhizoctonia solani]|uniref:Uncharacterized protein n=1 Tax=Rhizoctonia solani TaxID=456999 RepID=A0A0K6FPD7_9AGAM|nr:hypothetical protein RSOLAG22IIIB_07732 [Rhizoctonia solani]
MSAAKFKKSTTVLLIGDDATRKLNFITFIDAVCTGKTADGFLDSTPVVAAQTSPLRSIQCTDTTRLNIANYPESLSTNQSTRTEDVLAWLKQWTTTIDAFVVLVDSSQSAISAGTLSTLETLSTIFPRPIRKNVFFLFVTTDPSGTAAIDVESTNGIPSWLSPDNIVLLEDFIAQRTNVLNRIQAKQGTPASLRQLFARKYTYGISDLGAMLESVDQSVIQSYDMGHLYMRATQIESEIYEYIGEGSVTTLGSETLQKINALVGEYCLIVQTPDFSTHVELVSALIRGGSERGISGMDNHVKKLTDIRSTVRVLESGSEKFPKGFAVY